MTAFDVDRAQRRPVRSGRLVTAARPWRARASRTATRDRSTCGWTPTRTWSASDVVNGYEEAELRRVIRKYGDERFAHRIAEAIVAARPIETTTELAAVVTARDSGARRAAPEAIPPSARSRRSASRSTASWTCCPTASSGDRAVVPGGRIAVLSYHSGEDRIVKERFRVREPAVRMPTRAALRVRRGADRADGARRAPSADGRRAGRQPACRFGAPPRRRADGARRGEVGADDRQLAPTSSGRSAAALRRAAPRAAAGRPSHSCRSSRAGAGRVGIRGRAHDRAGGLVLGFAVLHTSLAERQMEIDRSKNSVDEARSGSTCCGAPHRVASASGWSAEASARHVAGAQKRVHGGRRLTVAITIAAAGEVLDDDVRSRAVQPLDQFRLVKAMSSEEP